MAPENITLTDTPTGSTANVLTGFGFNCYSFQPVVDGRPVEVLWSVPAFASGTERPSRCGIPVLFPFPGRIRGTSFKFNGQSYTLEPGDPLGNAIHGLVLNRPWRVLEQTASRVLAEFHTRIDAPELLERWPADFRIRGEYELVGNALRGKIEISNPDQRPLPFGLGTHPYFRVPPGSEGNRDECIVTVPVRKFWDLKDMLPTGRVLGVEGEATLGAGMRFGDMQFDDVFTGLQFDRGWCTTSIHDPSTARTVVHRFDEAFRECVMYTPPHREAVCIEPYTCVPDPFTLTAAGIDSGLRVLPPGELLTARFEIRAEAAST